MRLPTILLLAIGLFHLGDSVVDPSEPGIRVRVTKAGLDYADHIGAILLNSLIGQSQIPDIKVDLSGGPGTGVATAQNMRITAFRPLTYSYALHPPNGLEWATKGGSITIAGDWIAWYKILFTVWFRGGFTASVNDIRLSATVSAIKDTDGKPAVKVLSCSSKIGSVSVQITGGFIQSIINLFRSNIATAVKSALETQVCQQARTVLVSVLNEKLKSLPTKVSLGDGFMLDYSLHSSPAVGDDYAEGALNGSITWRDGSSAPIDCPPLPPATGPTNRMVYIWGSDYVLNTFFHSAHIHNASRVDVDGREFPEAAPYLRTTCPGQVCVGNISHLIREQYPNKTTEVELLTTSPPQAVITSQTARLSATVRANLFVEPRSAQNLLIVFDMVFAGDLTVKVVNEGDTNAAFEQAPDDFGDYLGLGGFEFEEYEHLWRARDPPPFDPTAGPRLAGNLAIDQFSVHINRSNVGYISALEIDLVVTFARPFLQKLANSYLNAGVVVPTIPDVKLLNAQVTLMERAVQVDADLIYKNYSASAMRPGGESGGVVKRCVV